MNKDRGNQFRNRRSEIKNEFIQISLRQWLD